MKRFLFLTVLLTVTIIFVGCASQESVMAPAGDAPENPRDSGGKYTPTVIEGQAGTSSDESADQLEAVAE